MFSARFNWTRFIYCGLIIFVFQQIPDSTSELFTAVSHLKSLVGIEQRLASYLKIFISEEQKKLDMIKVYLNKSRHLLELNTLDETKVSSYVGNPINSFLVMKRLLRFGSEVERLIDIDLTKALVTQLQAHTHVFPSDDDVKGAQSALLRLQQTYNLPPATFSDGIAPNASVVSQMNAEDAFAIGKEAYSNADFNEAEMWMREALRLMGIGRGMGTSANSDTHFEVLDHLAWAEYSNGNYNDATKHTVQLLHIDPSNERLQSNLVLYQRLLSEERAKRAIESKFSKKRKIRKAKKRKNFRKFYYTKDEDIYKRYLVEKTLAKSLCRGETRPLAKKYRNKLSCWFKRSHPRLILKPGKVERIYVGPEIVIFRDVFADSQIQRIKDVAMPLLSRATVHNPQTGKIEHARYRISKSAWLDPRHDPLFGKIDSRIEALTGLSMESAETLQVANYGIGGHYDTHFDFSRTVSIRPPPFRRNSSETIPRSNIKKSAVVEKSGERIATFLLYMSDVEMGGGTVFTNIRQQIRPSKGDAVFWYNLNDDGSGDYNTRHAACPVLLGEKWVANKWIHEVGQEFRRLCPLKRYHADND